MTQLPIANINTIEKQTIGNGENFSAKVARFSTLLNMKQLGCSLVELAPGEKGWPYHLHYGLDELFVVLTGQGSIRYDGNHYPLTEGDVIYAAAGDGSAHQIINTSDSPLKYLAISSENKNPEVCYYPDSGKYGCYRQDAEGNWQAFMAHESAALTYYDGEQD